MASFVQTCKGGSIGREGNHDVLLDDIACSKTHAQITFDEKEAKYFIVDIGSSNGNDVFASPMHLVHYFVFYVHTKAETLLLIIHFKNIS